MENNRKINNRGRGGGGKNIQDSRVEEEKDWRHGSRGTKGQLLIDKAVIRNCKRRETNLNMAWVYFRKSPAMVPHTWIIKASKLIRAEPNFITLFK